ncbi:MAG: hypothetical protein ACKV2O_07125 [Acidimicrobiales bacterium]
MALVALVTLVALLALVALVVMYTVATGYAHDHRSLDDDAIVKAATSGCRAVNQAFDGAGLDRLERIAAGNTGIAQLIATMEDLGESKLRDDPPAAQWVEDWRRLALARSALAQRLAATEDEAFVIPLTDDGYPITRRMASVAPLECDRAVELSSQP